ncbi:SWIM zinc finger family protein [Verrucosispora sp. WMMD573]|uniref:SWIM zinc finger family protein n=1 Tax=Verrucosispora sp. WMMD573 TaxID=3015149 RepID=UPI00248D272F|nr:SWIM zinc finger family protein [Verrucosispora sp. WMMD573]WBB54364.1 SWIM zinc finger family protein [Verrucosispora sp. WMMD573]
MRADDGGRFADYGPPRRVDGGLRARSTRGAIGVSWWSRRFLEVLESFALGTRLTRGRSYARAGQVLRLDVAPGVVTAVVQGSRARPYQVSVALPPFPVRLWTRIEGQLAARAFFSARLLAGDLPAELEELFVAADAPLFPAAISDLDQRCSCPDVAVPCKHLAATFYLLAEAFDADPFTLLHWRGRSRADLLARLRQLRADASGTEAPPGLRPGGREPAGRRRGGGDPAGRADGPAQRDVTAPTNPTGHSASSGAGTADTGWPGDPELDVPAAGSVRALADLSVTPLAEAVDRFWLPPVPLPDRPPSLTARPDLLLRQLGAPAPAIGGPGLVERLRHAYRQLGEQ